jgi:DNA (cytosine-5)-methyltransferase 1
VAQRRRRVFVVASAGNLDPAKVLFESEGVRRDSAPSREARKDVTEVAGTLSANGGGTTRPAGNCNELDFCVTGFYPQMKAESMCPTDNLSPCLINGTNPGFQNGVFIYRWQNNDAGIVPDDVSATIKAKGTTTDERSVGAIVCSKGIGVDCYNGAITGEVAATFGANSGGTNNAGPKVLDHAPTCFKVRCGCEGGGKGYLGQEEAAFTLATGADQHLFHQMAVRRLVPEECEKLQGFLPGYTKIPYNGKPADKCPDGPRYKALGNSWAVPCARWIFERIAKQ